MEGLVLNARLTSSSVSSGLARARMVNPIDDLVRRRSPPRTTGVE